MKWWCGGNRAIQHNKLAVQSHHMAPHSAWGLLPHGGNPMLALGFKQINCLHQKMCHPLQRDQEHCMQGGLPASSLSHNPSEKVTTLCGSQVFLQTLPPWSINKNFTAQFETCMPKKTANSAIYSCGILTRKWQKRGATLVTHHKLHLLLMNQNKTKNQNALCDCQDFICCLVENFEWHSVSFLPLDQSIVLIEHKKESTGFV